MFVFYRFYDRRTNKVVIKWICSLCGWWGDIALASSTQEQPQANGKESVFFKQGNQSEIYLQFMISKWKKNSAFKILSWKNQGLLADWRDFGTFTVPKVSLILTFILVRFLLWINSQKFKYTHECVWTLDWYWVSQNRLRGGVPLSRKPIGQSAGLLNFLYYASKWSQCHEVRL